MYVIVFAMILMLGDIAGCTAAGTAASPCPTGQEHAWCLMEVSTTTFADLSRQCAPNKTQTTIAACIPKGDPTLQVTLIVAKATNWLRANYQTVGPAGIQDLIVKGDQVISAKFVTDPRTGETQCRVGGDTNPFGTLWVSIDTNALHGPKFHPQGDPGGGGGAESDCEACLANAGCTPTDLGQCAHDHCAALCPDTSAGGTCSSTPAPDDCAVAGETCGTALCCAGLTCFASDVGSVCQ